MKNLLKILIIGLSLPFLASANSFPFPPFPMAFWGSVTVNNNPAPAGAKIKAYYGSKLAGEVDVTKKGIYGYPESTKQKLVVGEGTGPITFTIQYSSLNSGNETGGSNQPSYPGFVSGLTVQKDLNFVISETSNSTSNPGGGGGGGGGTPPSDTSTSTTDTSTTTTKESISRGDANSDGRVDILDFNVLMVNFGKTGSEIAGDLNGDNRVDIFDFNILMVNWSK